MIKFIKVTEELIKIDADNAKEEGLEPINPIIAKYLNKDILDIETVCSEDGEYKEYEEFKDGLGNVEYKRVTIGTGYEEEYEVAINGEKGVLIADHGCTIWFK